MRYLTFVLAAILTSCVTVQLPKVNEQPKSYIAPKINSVDNKKHSLQYRILKSLALVTIQDELGTTFKTGSAVCVGIRQQPDTNKYVYVFLSAAHVLDTDNPFITFKIVLSRANENGIAQNAIVIDMAHPESNFVKHLNRDQDVGWFIFETKTKLPIIPARMASSRTLNDIELGSLIYVGGSPKSLPPILFQGFLSLKNIYIGPIDSYKIKVNIVGTTFDPGISGGGVFNNKGEVIGIASMSLGHVGLYISIRHFYPLMIKDEATSTLLGLVVH